MMTKNPKNFSERFQAMMGHQTASSSPSLSNVDRISSLPDSLLRLIIYNLRNPNQMILTSILSKRWRYLAISLPDLHFICNPWYNPDKLPLFPSFIHHALTHREPLNVRKLHFNCYAPLDPKLVHDCICYAIRHNVEILRLHLGCTDGRVLEFPPSLLGCDSVRELEIIDYVGRNKVPTMLNLPNLKTLNLSSISFMDGNFDGRILTGCPSLDVLILTNCDFTSLKISAPNLTKLEILFFDPTTDCGDPMTPWGHVPVQNTGHDPILFERKVVASLPNLSSFKFRGSCSLEFCPIGSIPSVSAVDIDVFLPYILGVMYSDEFVERMAGYLVKSLEHFHNTRFLTLSFTAVKLLSMIRDLEERKPLPFTSLRNLKLRVETTRVWPENALN